MGSKEKEEEIKGFSFLVIIGTFMCLGGMMSLFLQSGCYETIRVIQKPGSCFDRSWYVTSVVERAGGVQPEEERRLQETSQWPASA